jgi:hypothetical protein
MTRLYCVMIGLHSAEGKSTILQPTKKSKSLCARLAEIRSSRNWIRNFRMADHTDITQHNGVYRYLARS